jgi:CRP-like cAMP-binding protein
VSEAPYRAIVQAPGRALTLPAARLAAAMGKCEQLRFNLLRYAHVFGVQIAQTALSNGSFTVPQRLARWLLMVEDRLGSADMMITHEFLSAMLDVGPREVVKVLEEFEGKRLIEAKSESVKILDRKELRELADSA